MPFARAAEGRSVSLEILGEGLLLVMVVKSTVQSENVEFVFEDIRTKVSGRVSVIPVRPVAFAILAMRVSPVVVFGFDGLRECSSGAVRKVSRRLPLERTAMFSIHVGRGY